MSTDSGTDSIRFYSSIPKKFRHIECPYPVLKSVPGRYGSIHYGLVGRFKDPSTDEFFIGFHGLSGSLQLFREFAVVVDILNANNFDMGGGNYTINEMFYGADVMGLSRVKKDRIIERNQKENTQNLENSENGNHHVKNKNFALLIFDLYGHGLSNCPKASFCSRKKKYNARFFVEQFYDLIIEIGLFDLLPYATLMGFSLGGSICISLLSETSEYTKSQLRWELLQQDQPVDIENVNLSLQLVPRRVVLISPSGFVPKKPAAGVCFLKSTSCCSVPLSERLLGCTCLCSANPPEFAQFEKDEWERIRRAQLYERYSWLDPEEDDGLFERSRRTDLVGRSGESNGTNDDSNFVEIHNHNQTRSINGTSPTGNGSNSVEIHNHDQTRCINGTSTNGRRDPPPLDVNGRPHTPMSPEIPSSSHQEPLWNSKFSRLQIASIASNHERSMWSLYVKKGTMEATFATISNFPFFSQKTDYLIAADRLKTNKIPICLLWGGMDDLNPVKNLGVIKEIFKECNVTDHVVPGCGHVVIGQHPMAVITIIFEFVCGERFRFHSE